MVYLCIGADDAGGKMRLNSLGQLKIEWAGGPDQAIFKEMNEEVERHAETLGGTSSRTSAGLSWADTI